MTSTNTDSRAAYSDIDHTESEQKARLIRLLDTQNEWDDIQAGKQMVLEELAIQPGWTVLDAGAGTGYDLQILGELVAPGGRVVGIDASEEMVGIARQRLASSGLPVEVLQADIASLPFGNATFDAVRSERVFQHLQDVPAALDELIRVTKPGGRIVVFDTDVSSYTSYVGLPDLEARLYPFWNGGPGAKNVCRLPYLMNERGLTSISIRPQLVYHDASSWGRFLELQGDQHPALIMAREQGIIDATEFDAYVAAQACSIEDGTYFGWGVMIVVAGTKPA